MNWSLATPEITLSVAGLAILLLGVFLKREGSFTCTIAVLMAFALTAVLVLQTPDGAGYSGLFLSDGFARFAQLTILAGGALCAIMALDYNHRQGIARFEYPVLILFSTVGMLTMAAAGSLMTLYMGLELQSLAIYVLAAFTRDDVRSSEAGLKYFVLGALSSGLLLFGASLVYGFTGTTNFDQIAAVLAGAPQFKAGIIVGMVFMAAGLAFKVAAVPFHMWAPDVYEGSPTSVTAFFAAAPKVAAVALLLRVLVDPFGGLTDQWREIVTFMAVVSMILGAVGAIQQTNIKRLMAYGSIGHIGYILLGLAAGSEMGVRGILIYLAVYLVMTVGTFAVILSMRQQGRPAEELAHFAGLSRTHPMMALAMAVFMFSMAGVPPLAGFFGKLYVFLAAINAHLYGLAVIGVITSVVAAFYYLRIVKLMYFDESPAEAIDRQDDGTVAAVLVGSAVFTALFFIFPVPISSGAAAAAAALFPG